MFDSIKRSIQKSFGFAADKSKEAWEIANLKSSIWMLNKQRAKHLQELGEEVYKIYLNQKADLDNLQDLSKVKGFCIEIGITEAEIIKVQEKIKEVGLTHRNDLEDLLVIDRRCPKCAFEVGEKSDICSNCGTNVPR